MSRSINPQQIRLIHTLKGALALDDATYRDILAGYRVESSKELSYQAAKALTDDLTQKAIAAGVWKRKSAPRGKGKRPQNMTGPEYRAAQLQKIEALLTVGGKPWQYADALARRICKVEKIAWVPEEELYKIITALRYQAKREGWDLSGEGR